jgi:hypothetical protein
MRDALMREFQARMNEDKSGQKAKEAFSAISKAAGLTVQSTHPWEMMNEVYKAIYLNFGNLFAGPGAVNRVIGLTADDITSKGLALLSQNVPIDESEIERNFDEVALLIANKSDQTEAQAFIANKQHRLDDEGLERFIEGHEHFFDTISDYLIDAEDAFTGRVERGESVLASEIGNIFIEIGANFGFDIPLEGVGKEHMEVFIETEQFLASYNGSNTGGLATVLAKFMQLANILSKS